MQMDAPHLGITKSMTQTIASYNAKQISKH